jgi:uncharacterized protein (UPF0261 family)
MAAMATIVLLGTLDTKGNKYAYLRDQIQRYSSCKVLLVDAGVLGEAQTTPDISRENVAGAAGSTIDELVAMNDRGAAIATMAVGASKIVSKLFDEGGCRGFSVSADLAGRR